MPPMPETDTKLSTNYSNATLNYTAEKHQDILTGTQLGSLVTVGDLRDVEADYNFDAHCAELIYHRYGNCGSGCKSVEDRWSTFTIESENALQTGINYVRGCGAYGCPEYLTPPTNTGTYWMAGWRGNGQFGYYQPQQVTDLPQDAKGDMIVLSQDPTTKRTLVGSIPLNCILSNLVGNLGMDVDSVWSVIEETAGFSATFDKMTGEFVITWNDWNDTNNTQHAGEGHIYGQLQWTVSFDVKTGDVIYNITNLHFKNAVWTAEQGVTISKKPSVTVWGISLPGTERVQVLSKQNYSTSWSETINIDVPCNQTVVMSPGSAPQTLNFAYIWDDWVGDDRGYLGVKFSNKLNSWKMC